MRRVVFYSWQSDLPNPTNRGLVQSALEIAAKAIAGDDTLDVEPVIDRDTEGVAGSPDIASTILKKIDAADILVADVSIVSEKSAERPAPNPNVMIEVGYALKSLSFERVILVFNTAFGEIESLPFDLRMRRLVLYSSAVNESDRATPRAELARRLEGALRSALMLVPTSEALATESLAVEAIESQRPNRRITIRNDLAKILQDFDNLDPPKVSKGAQCVMGDGLIEAIEKTQPIVARFSKIAEMTAVMNDAVAALEIYNWFGLVLERYSLPRGFSGISNEADFDFFRFVGHELFVTFFSFLLREQQWQIILKLLNEPIPVRYLNRYGGPGNAEWSDLSRHVRVLGGESQRRGRLSLHGDILNARHSKGYLAGILPFDEFADADFFLYLRGVLPYEKPPQEFAWKPWSVIWLGGTPRFLLRAQSGEQANNVARALTLPSATELKTRLLERGSMIAMLYRHGFWDYPVRRDDIEKIGSRK